MTGKRISIKTISPLFSFFPLLFPSNSSKRTSPHASHLHSLINLNKTSPRQPVQDSSTGHSYPEHLIPLFAQAPRTVTSDTAKDKPHLGDRNNNSNIQYVTGVLYPFIIPS